MGKVEAWNGNLERKIRGALTNKSPPTSKLWRETSWDFN